jgi:heme/copper-type cytochrome/quinol oxidase subunit 3
VGVRETERERERERERAEMKKMAQQKEINNKEQEKSYRITLGIASFVTVQLILFWTFVVWYRVVSATKGAQNIYYEEELP